LRPLTDSTRGSPKATAAVDWTPPMVAAFEAARTALGAAALLAHPQQDQELAVMVDASADHFGAALQQRQLAAADWQPLAFFSKKLEPAQMRYSAFDRELFACVAGIRHFRYMLEGRPFTIYTDLRAGQGLGAVDGHAVETALLHGRVHNRYPAHTGF
jgi:hypothetical protein